MVVCKFFLHGYCRNGSNCRFEHAYSSKYSYHANAQPQNVSQTNSVTDEQLVNQVQSDLQAGLYGGQWLLSCYAPFKGKGLFPGISDLSPEEARLFIYETRASNNLDEAIAFMNNVIQETRCKYNQLMQPNPNIIKVLRGLYNGEVVQSPFSGAASNNSNTAASSIFRSAAQSTSVFGSSNNTSNIFGQQPAKSDAKSVFAQAAAPSVFGANQNSSNVFGQAQNTAASVFGQANQNMASNIFGQVAQNQNVSPSVFGQQQQADTGAKSIFAQASQNVFGSTPQPNPASIFASATQNVFGNTEGATHNSAFAQNQSNVFQKTHTQSNIFGAQNVFENQAQVNDRVYSKVEDIPPDDIHAFEAESFELGFVPDVPPPRSLCI